MVEILRLQSVRVVEPFDSFASVNSTARAVAAAAVYECCTFLFYFINIYDCIYVCFSGGLPRLYQTRNPTLGSVLLVAPYRWRRQ